MRTWLYQRMINDATLLNLMRRTISGVLESDADVRKRFFASGSMTTSTTPKPFIVYLMGNRTDQQMAEADYRAHRQFWQVWVHDAPADYARIDSIHDRIEDLFFGATSAADGVANTIHLERSRDFDDELLKTVFKYARFQSIIQKVG